jgi:hypothetical protein
MKDKEKSEREIQDYLDKNIKSELEPVIEFIHQVLKKEAPYQKSLPGFQDLLKKYPDLLPAPKEKYRFSFRQFFFSAFATLITIVLLWVFFLFKKSNHEISISTAEILNAHGNILYDSTRVELLPQTSLSLSNGSTFQLSTHSNLEMNIDNFTAVSLKENSHLKIVELLKTKHRYMFFLLQGEARFSVAKLREDERYMIQTPTATVEVKGTVFTVRIQNSLTTVSVQQGTVLIKSNKPQGSPEFFLSVPEEVMETEKHQFIKTNHSTSNNPLERKPNRIKKKGLLTDSFTPQEKEWKGKDRITLHDGQVLEGTVRSMDDQNLFLDTGTKVITLSKKDIKKQEIIKRKN